MAYKATPKSLTDIDASFYREYFCFDDINIEAIKTLYIEGIKNNSTGFWNPRDSTGAEDIIVSDDYTVYKYNTADNKGRLISHLRDEFAKQKLKQYNWLVDDKPVEIEYKINRNGFRCNNFTNDPGIVFVGCSNTYGTGMHLQDIWPSIVASHFDLESWNLGTPGMGLTMSTFYLTNWYNDIPNPRAIVVLEPPPDRVELYYFKNEKFEVDIFKSLLDQYEVNPMVNYLYSSLPFTAAINYRLNIQALRLLAKQWNVPFVTKTLFQSATQLKTAPNIETDFARDLMHFGKNVHIAIAEKMIEALKDEGL